MLWKSWKNIDRIYDCPIVQIIPLNRMLLDWTATHNDVQRHSGIGHRVDKTYEHVLDQFQRGVYNSIEIDSLIVGAMPPPIQRRRD